MKMKSRHYTEQSEGKTMDYVDGTLEMFGFGWNLDQILTFGRIIQNQGPKVSKCAIKGAVYGVRYSVESVYIFNFIKSNVYSQMYIVKCI